MNTNLRWRVNDRIRAEKVRVIGADGKQVGVFDLQKALELAKEEELDLIEIAPQAKPPVVKIQELGKFLYQEEKKLRAEKKKTKASELKEVRFSPFIAENDFATRIGRVREFLEDKNKVKIVVKFKGRQMDAKGSGYEITRKVLNSFGDTIAIDMEPKFLGRHLVMVISPTNKIRKTVEKNKESTQGNEQKESIDAKTEN